ncbi:hypothetical protein ACFX2I_041718 [Malus domestica]
MTVGGDRISHNKLAFTCLFEVRAVVVVFLGVGVGDVEEFPLCETQEFFVFNFPREEEGEERFLIAGFESNGQHSLIRRSQIRRGSLPQFFSSHIVDIE